MQQYLLSIIPRSMSRRLLGLLACALFGSGCATAPQTRVVLPDSAPSSPAVSAINSALASAALQTADVSADYRLGAEDLLEITIFNIPEGGEGPIPRRLEVRLSQEGLITLPLLGDILAAGLSTAALEQSLRKRYDEFLHNPQVGVQVKEYRGQQVSVMGAVGRPGMYQLTGPRTLTDLLSMAGGINERAGGQVHIYRQGPEGRQTYVVDLLALANNPGLVNMRVEAGDVINVPLAGMFFVDGAVRRPGSFALSRPYTLTQALAMAGGADDTLADYGGVAILRRRNGLEAEKLSVDLKEIQAARAPDPWIEAEDVVVVPVSTAKWFVERFIGRIGVGGLGTIRPPVGF
jgi:polysaccharide export outer membrane protein